MSRDLELSLGGGLEPEDAMQAFNKGVAFDVAKVEERQAVVDEMMTRNYRSPERRVKWLNSLLSGEWDDDFGISYLHIAGAYLPGLVIHGVAEKMAFSACDVPNADFRGARMNASVFTASSFPDMRARGANMDDTLFNFAYLAGADFEDVAAVDSQFNFADFTGIHARGSIFTNSFLIGARGLNETILADIADISSARVLPRSDKAAGATEALRDALAGRFADVKGEVLGALDPVRILRGMKIANALPDQKDLEGVVLDDMILTDTRLPGRQMTGNFWHNIHGRGIVLRSTKAAGLIMLNSDLQDGNANRLWAPGMFAANSNIRNMSMVKANLGGAVLLNVIMEGVDLDGANTDGMVIIGGRPPELDPDVRNRVKIVQLGDLPERVANNVMRLGSLSIDKPARPTTPELGQ